MGEAITLFSPKKYEQYQAEPTKTAKSETKPNTIMIDDKVISIGDNFMSIFNKKTKNATCYFDENNNGMYDKKIITNTKNKLQVKEITLNEKEYEVKKIQSQIINEK